MRSHLENLLQDSLPPEFTAEEACELLAPHYRAPLKHLGLLQRSGEIIRLKRGLYVFANRFDALATANAIHGPSYISFETALAYYGLIPERVPTVLSVVDGRSASFATPVGLYQYHQQQRSLFALGMSMQRLETRSYLIATREKAVLDTLSRAQLKAAALSPTDVLAFALDSLRIDREMLQTLSPAKLSKMAISYRNLAPRKLAAALRANARSNS